MRAPVGQGRLSPVEPYYLLEMLIEPTPAVLSQGSSPPPSEPVRECLVQQKVGQRIRLS